MRRLTAFKSPHGDSSRSLSTDSGWTNLRAERPDQIAFGVHDRSEFRKIWIVGRLIKQGDTR
jgi:hypothetical protein